MDKSVIYHIKNASKVKYFTNCRSVAPGLENSDGRHPIFFFSLGPTDLQASMLHKYT